MTILVIPSGTTRTDYRQYERHKMTSVVIPGSVVRIGDFSFFGCVNLNALVIPDGVRSIGYNAFDSCIQIKTLKLPDGIKEIGFWSFNECSDIKDLIIPTSLTIIGRWAFLGCSGIQRVWNKSKCGVNNITPWVHLRGPTPPLKQLEKWTFALHWHWRYPDHITPEQARLFSVGIHCLSVPIELCQLVFSYIPRDVDCD
jgi:hypothetical protein